MMNHSTGTPTQAQQRRFVAIKEDGCLCCRIDGNGFFRCEIHHLLIAGAKRRGHDFSIGLCPHHHRNVPGDLWMLVGIERALTIGPSLAAGSKPFHEYYGSDEKLLALQNFRLCMNGHGATALRVKPRKSHTSSKIVARR